MKLKMLKSVRGAHDGMHVISFDEGSVHEFGPEARSLELAKTFLREKWAVEVKAEEKKPEGKKPESGAK